MAFKNRYKDMGPLHALLIEACPPDPENGVKSIPALARAMGMTNWGIYKWIHEGRIPPRQAMRIVDLSQGRVSLANFHPFIFID